MSTFDSEPTNACLPAGTPHVLRQRSALAVTRSDERAEAQRQASAEGAAASAAISIVTRDRPVGTLASIRSALMQMHTRCDIYVVDRGSAPVALARLVAFCAQYPRVQLLAPGRRLGRAAAANVAARATGAPILISLEPGVRFVDPRCVVRLLARFAVQPRLAGLALALRGARPQPILSAAAAHSGEALASFELSRNLGAAYAFRRDLLAQVGGYDEGALLGGAEREAARRMLELGYSLAYCPDCMVERT